MNQTVKWIVAVIIVVLIAWFGWPYLQNSDVETPENTETATTTPEMVENATTTENVVDTATTTEEITTATSTEEAIE